VFDIDLSAVDGQIEYAALLQLQLGSKENLDLRAKIGFLGFLAVGQQQALRARRVDHLIDRLSNELASERLDVHALWHGVLDGARDPSQFGLVVGKIKRIGHDSRLVVTILPFG
jgi:hypothetical protein